MKEKILIVEDQFVEADYLRQMLHQAGYTVTGIARSVSQALEMIADEMPGFVLLDIFLKGKQTGLDLGVKLSEAAIPFIYISANSHEEVLNIAKTTQPYGFIVKPFREQDLLVTLEIARYRYEHSVQSRTKHAKELIQQIQRIADKKTNGKDKMLETAVSLQSFIPFDYLTIGIERIGSSPDNVLSFLRIGFDEYQVIGAKELQTISGKSREELASLAANETSMGLTSACLISAPDKTLHPASLTTFFAGKFGLQSKLVMLLPVSGEGPVAISLFSRLPNAYNADHAGLLESVRQALSAMIASSVVRPDPAATVIVPNNNNIRIVNKERKEWFSGIVGKSHLLLNTLSQVSQVAATETSVLLLGESGTGKECIADAIHQLSSRKEKPFIKVNCAGLPASLIESELFGHEKGAFTGANERRIGKFKRADKGTLLLDEIGEMPVELQAKLLRVLQEKEIERLGGSGPVRVDVRIIAATNKQLEKEVAEGRFRLDLYYRLNVFPIELPSLRDRKEDIIELAYYFVEYYNHKSGKKVTEIKQSVLSTMMDYYWPGNIRELRHMIERAVLLCNGTTIEDIPLPLAGLHNQPAPGTAASLKTIEENERDHILSVLKQCNGKVWGAGAAAEILNIHPSTLKSRMKKLGIKKEYNH